MKRPLVPALALTAALSLVGGALGASLLRSPETSPQTRPVATESEAPTPVVSPEPTTDETAEPVASPSPEPTATMTPVTKPKTQTDAERAELAAVTAEGAAQTAVGAAERAEDAVAKVEPSPAPGGSAPFVGVGEWHTLGTATSAPLTNDSVLGWDVHTLDFRFTRDWPEPPAGCVDGKSNEVGWMLLVQLGQWEPWPTTNQPDGRRLLIRSGLGMGCTGVYENHALAGGPWVENYPDLFVASIDWIPSGKLAPGQVRPPKPAPVTITVEERY